LYFVNPKPALLKKWFGIKIGMSKRSNYYGMIIYIYGEDTFSSRQYLGQQIERFKKERDPQGLNVVVIDGAGEKADVLWREITASPFLAEKRLVVIQNILTNKHADTLESLLEGVSQHKVPEKNIVIFWQGQPLGKTKAVQQLHKLLAAEKWAKEFTALTGVALGGWIKTEVAARGGKIAAPASQYLQNNAGFDMWYLHSLIDQLVAYANGREISLADAQIFLEEKIDDNIFNMVDAIVAGNKKQAFLLLEKQRQLGQDEGYIFSMILRQFRILISMRDLYNRQADISSAELAQSLSLHPFVAKKSLPFIKKYSFSVLASIYNRLLEIDIKTKTGLADQSWLIDVFVGSLPN
jgi:DNA polymerase-3 subunit delta